MTTLSAPNPNLENLGVSSYALVTYHELSLGTAVSVMRDVDLARGGIGI
jgi:hypothetical protein